jgi:GT2 family glycosyltransferase
VSGFDEQLQVAFNDIDFCLRVRERGYRIVWTPYCELIHYESVSRGFDLNWREVEFMQRRWGQALLTDPYYNPNLTLERGNFRIRLWARAPAYRSCALGTAPAEPLISS